MKKTIIGSVILWGVLLLFLSMAGNAVAVEEDKPLKELGKYIFFDKISVPKRMSCSTCHAPEAGWTLKNAGTNLHQVAVTGADPHTAGSVKPPSNAYASFIPVFEFVGAPPLFPTGYRGGNFWNGRAMGRYVTEEENSPGATKHIGDEVFWTTDGESRLDIPQYAKYLGPVADQALNPMPNPVEQNIERKAVCRHVASAKYAELYKLAWGVEIDCSDVPVEVIAQDVDPAEGEKAYDISFKRMMLAVGAWQASDEVNSFSSKRDRALRNDADGKFPLDDFTDQENYGHDLFYATVFNGGVVSDDPSKNGKFANCSVCHLSSATRPDGTDLEERYTDDSYHAIGTPANPEIAGYPILDEGLAGHTGQRVGDPGAGDHRGFFKVPTLRNVDKRPGKGFTKAYTHNGWFKSLESIVHFYNTAAIKERCEGDVTEKEALAQNCWPKPEYQSAADTTIPGLIGNLGLKPEDEAAIVAYMKTFTDTETPKPPKPYKPTK